jgi:hypothetical protein
VREEERLARTEAKNLAPVVITVVLAIFVAAAYVKFMRRLPARAST